MGQPFRAALIQRGARSAIPERRVVRVGLAAAAANALLALIVATVARHSAGFPWIWVAAAAVIAGTAAAITFASLRDADPGRLQRLADLLAAISRGDLTGSIGSTRKDGLGDVERSVDDAIARMLIVVGTLQQGVERFHSGRLSVADVHKDMLDTAEMTAGQAYDAGVSAEQVSESINIVASSTEELAASVNEIARHATFAADVAKTAASQGEVAEQGVQELSTALQQVENIANVISAIAAQTHLLALNAMIEAARAGDAGRGFEVVAAEVKALSKATADATQQVRMIVAGIEGGSERAMHAISQISETMSLICESTASIASTVTEQSATTREIGRVSVIAARGASDIWGRVSAVHDRARDVAYVGATNDAAKAEEFGLLEAAFRTSIEGFDVGDFTAVIDVIDAIVVDQELLNREGTTTVDGVTTVLENVLGTELHQFEYTGAWLHGLGYETDPGGDAYSSMPGDEVTVRFHGRQIRFHGCKDKQQGMAEVWVDDLEPELIDFYGPDRGHQLLWESPELTVGKHTFHLRVSQKKNPASRYFWNSVAKVEIVD